MGTGNQGANTGSRCREFPELKQKEIVQQLWNRRKEKSRFNQEISRLQERYLRKTTKPYYLAGECHILVDQEEALHINDS